MENPYCFVIMPFGERNDAQGAVTDFDVVYDEIIEEVVANRLKIRCLRSDKVQAPGWIHRDMLQHIVQADVTVVDISTLNPNVFYELGVRHALRRGVTVLIRKNGTQIPFNIRGLRIIEYDLDIKSAHKAQDEIEKFIRNGLSAKSNDSLVYEIFPHLTVSIP
jgi:hypothetical protein